MLGKSLSLTKTLLTKQVFTNSWRNAYKSAICLENLFPKSNLDLTAKLSNVKLDQNEDSFSGYIPIGKLKKNKIFLQIFAN